MDRRDVVKRMAVAAGAASVAPLLQIAPAATISSPFLSHVIAAAHDHTGWQAPEDTTNYTPRFFTSAEYATVTTVCELIIPATDTPGARQAGVPQYLDDLLAETQRWETSAKQPERFKSGLQWLAQRCTQLHQQSNFANLSPAQQTSLLQQMESSPDDDPGHRFFELMKNSTIFAYYTSKAGMVDEWHYQMDYRDSYPGCTHPEHQQ